MATKRNIEDLKAGWAALAAGDMDKLASYYAEDMIFVLPGQDDVLSGRAAFRAALDTADKIPAGSQCAVLFKFNDDGLVTEERWFVDTEQWKAAF